MKNNEEIRKVLDETIKSLTEEINKLNEATKKDENKFTHEVYLGLDSAEESEDGSIVIEYNHIAGNWVYIFDDRSSYTYSIPKKEITVPENINFISDGFGKELLFNDYKQSLGCMDGLYFVGIANDSDIIEQPTLEKMRFDDLCENDWFYYNEDLDKVGEIDQYCVVLEDNKYAWSDDEDILVTDLKVLDYVYKLIFK